MIKYCLPVLYSLLLSNNVYAQNNALTAVLNQTLGTVQAVPPVVPGAAPSAPGLPSNVPPAGAPVTPVVDPNLSLGGVGPGNAKYEEYQSICRTNDYDQIFNYSEELKEKRITFLKNKIKSAEFKKLKNESVKIKLRLAKEYFDQVKVEELSTLVQVLKSEKISTFDNEYLNAIVTFSNNDLNTSRTILNKLLSDNKDNVDVLPLLAEVYLAEKNYYEASAIYEDLNKLTQNAYIVQQCQTLVLNSLNADGEALCLQAAVKFPQNPLSSIYVGIAHRERGDFKKAMLSFKKSIAIVPSEMGLTCLAEVFYIKENFKEAIVNFKKSIELSPKSERAILGLGWSELKQKNYAESILAFKKACKINGKNQIEVRKVFKALSAERIPVAKKFIQLAEGCGG